MTHHPRWTPAHVLLRTAAAAQPIARPLIAALALAAPALLAGCQSQPSVNTVGNADIIGQPTVVPDQRVITDPNFNKRVRVARIIENTGPSGNRIVEVELYNNTKAVQYYRHRFSWYDEAGMSVHAINTVWTDAFIEPGAAARIRSVAPNARAKDFRLELMTN
jgi:uncharacterized protein YcfL